MSSSSTLQMQTRCGDAGSGHQATRRSGIHRRSSPDCVEHILGPAAWLTLQECDPGCVRAEVRFLIDTFDQSAGEMRIAAGNSIVSGTPFENIEAFLDEAVRYGVEHGMQSIGSPID